MSRRRGTLAGQLQPRLVIIVALLAVLVVASTLFAARTILYNQLDAELASTQVRQGRGPGPGRSSYDIPGQRVGTVIVFAPTTGDPAGKLVGDGEFVDLEPDVATAIAATPADDAFHTVELPGLGTYRVVHYHTDEGAIIVGLPTSEIDSTLGLLAVFASGVGLVAVGATSLATRAVLTRATRPLMALGATADEVSALDLARGSVAVPRVAVPSGARSNEVTRVAQAFNHMLGRVEDGLAERERSEEKLRRFVADASHELRNPLAAIRGYAELAERAPEGETSYALGRISAESKRMTKLVNDLLLLARLDADAKVEPKPVDVVEVVLNAVGDAQATSRDHRWQLALPEEGIEVLADADQLQQVMVNLLSNARTHTPPGTTVTTSVRAEGGEAVVEVIDDGPGIDPDTLERVFERFTRADDSRAHNVTQSTGLGLAIVKAVVGGFAGRSEVESRPGRTVFRVRLPLSG